MGHAAYENMESAGGMPGGGGGQGGPFPGAGMQVDPEELLREFFGQAGGGGRGGAGFQVGRRPRRGGEPSAGDEWPWPVLVDHAGNVNNQLRPLPPRTAGHRV